MPSKLELFEQMMAGRPEPSDSYIKHAEREERRVDNKKPQTIDEAREQQQAHVGLSDLSLKATDMHRGVSTGWLAEVFNLDPATVRKRLATCPPLRTTRQGHRYSLPQAAAYLIKPVFDIEKYLKTMKPEELPSQLQDRFWAAQIAKQRALKEAGDLWHTQDVQDLLAETFLLIKTTVQLWTEEVERAKGLSAEQRKVIVDLADALQNEIRAKLVNGDTGAEAKPLAAEYEDEEENYI